MFGVIAVACVGNGTVNVVPPVSAVARACAIKVVPRMKFTTGRPKPKSANPEPVIRSEEGRVGKASGLGGIPLTYAPGRGRFTGRPALPARLKVGVLEVCCRT